MTQVLSFAELEDRARGLALSGRRMILGIIGAPGAGKSTLAERLVGSLGRDLAVLVPMDGFHLAQHVLDELGRSERKGAHDTYDAWGYVALLRRLRDQPSAGGGDSGAPVYAPEFRRDIEEPVGSSLLVRASVPLVITEGNYLLLPEGPWADVRALLDEAWFLATPENRRREQLTARHERFGRSRGEAEQRTFGSDERNAEVIIPTSVHADLVIEVTDRGAPGRKTEGP